MKIDLFEFFVDVESPRSSHAIVDAQRVNKIVGGKGDKLSAQDVDVSELSLGIQIEMEHTTEDKVAEDIALDHLAEDPHYYSKLVTSDLADEFKSEPIVTNEQKSTTTYEEYHRIAERLIVHLKELARKGKRNYSDKDKLITPSLVKSVLIGLGNSNQDLSDTLKALEPLAYKPIKK